MLGFLESPKKVKNNMEFTPDQTEQEIFNALISRETNFKIGCVEFKEKLIEGTAKERERKCRARANKLVKLVEEC